MPLKQYGVLAGRVVGGRAEGEAGSPHFEIHVEAAGTDFRIAVNVLSQDSPSELLYAAVEDFRHPMLTALAALSEGFTQVPSQAGGLAVDFIRGNLFDRAALRVMPDRAPGPGNDLADALGHYAERARADPAAQVYAFGERWGPETGEPDEVFGFEPGNGVHDVHMNQGNSGHFARDDGVWQDGALLFHFPDPERWIAVFLAFQSQTWHTDDTTGHSLETGPGLVSPPGDPRGRVRIVAALVNAAGPAPEGETVTILNTAGESVGLAGWSLVDAHGARTALEPGELPAGETARVQVTPPLALSNSGGTISLLDAAGLKVDGVAYTGDQARAEGTTIVF